MNINKSFKEPRKKIDEFYFIRVRFGYSDLLGNRETIQDFNAVNIVELKKIIVNFAVQFNMSIIDTSNIYLGKSITSYEPINGFNLTNDLQERLKGGKQNV